MIPKSTKSPHLLFSINNKRRIFKHWAWKHQGMQQDLKWQPRSSWCCWIWATLYLSATGFPLDLVQDSWWACIVLC
jgi:hypothetical protein